MLDTLEIFGTEYTGVTGIKATDDNNQTKTYIRPQGTKSISSNGTGIDVTAYASVDVSVSASTPTLQTITKSYTPTESQQTETITAGSGYDGIEEVDVTVGAISSSYVGSGITRRDSTDLTASGATVSVPAGYYSAAASKSVATGSLNYSHWTETESNGNLTMTIDKTFTAGYLSSAPDITRVFTDVIDTTITPSTSQQVVTRATGNSFIKKVTVAAMPSGSATAPASISGTSATISTGTNTLTLTKTVSVTPTVTAGYVSSGTAGNSSISLTASVTVNPTPTASGQTVTIPAGYYSAQTTKDVSTLTLPTSTSASATSGYTSKATIYFSGSDQYINIPTGYNTVGAYYKVPAITYITLPSSAAASATSGYTSVATISRSTSDQYINIDKGYNSTNSYYKISAVPNGSATGPTSLSGSSATISTGTNTLTLTKTGVTTTPTVSAGYVESATASTATVALTASVTTKAAATITPTTTNQTIASGTYLTGTQTISGDANLVAGNIKKDVPIFGVTGSYEGSGSSSVVVSDQANSTGTTAVVTADDVTTLTTKTITQNGTYNASSDSVDGYSSVIVNVAGAAAASGLIYETGTYTPSSDTTTPYISFTDTHSSNPIYINIIDTTETLASENSMLSWTFIDWYDAFDSNFLGTSSTNYYGRYVYQYKTSSGVSAGTNESTTLTSNSGGLYYLLDNTLFAPYGFGSSRYWRSGRTYEWIAVWADEASGGPTTEIIVPEQTITVTQSYTEIQHNKPLVLGEEYIFTVNGVSKTLTTTNLSSSVGVVYETDVYFEFTQYDQMYFDIMDSSKYGTYTVKVEKVVSSVTQHTIHLEFSDSTDADIDVYYDDAVIRTMITNYMPTTWTYSNKTVVQAELDNVVWYDKTITWETVWDASTQFNAEPPEDSYAYITELGSVTITEGSKWRVTFGNEERIHTAVYGPPYPNAPTSLWHINSTTDGTDGVYSMWGNGTAWFIADFNDTSGHNKYVKIERQVIS